MNEELSPVIKPSYADAAGDNPSIYKKQSRKASVAPRKKRALWVGYSQSKNLDKDAFEEFTDTEVDMVTAYTVDADENAKHKDKNLIAIVQRNYKRGMLMSWYCNLGATK